MLAAGVDTEHLTREARIRWLDARLWSTYYATLASYYRTADLAATVVIALAASAAIAEGVRDTFLPAWQVLTGASVALTILRPSLLPSKRLTEMAQASGQWTQRVLEWERYRFRLQHGNIVSLGEAEAAMERDSRLMESTTELPDWPWLVKRCQRRIKKAEGLPFVD
jgi:hypothetical protein